MAVSISIIEAKYICVNVIRTFLLPILKDLIVQQVVGSRYITKRIISSKTI